MTDHVWIQENGFGGACIWLCVRCGANLESEYRPKVNDGILKGFDLFGHDWYRCKESANCDEELVRRVMES